MKKKEKAQVLALCAKQLATSLERGSVGGQELSADGRDYVLEQVAILLKRAEVLRASKVPG
jgi:hypothetical protein